MARSSLPQTANFVSPTNFRSINRKRLSKSGTDLTKFGGDGLPLIDLTRVDPPL